MVLASFGLAPRSTVASTARLGGGASKAATHSGGAQKNGKGAATAHAMAAAEAQ
jgi:hypothetical protein